MKKIKYEDLLEIKRPVLLFREAIDLYYEDDFLSKIRILYPDGKCEYRFLEGNDRETTWCESCFQRDSLVDTVRAMETWDTAESIYLIEEL